MRSDSKLGRGALLAAVLVGLVALVSGCHAASRDAAGPENTDRYSVLRTRQLLVRIDSSSGQVWLVPTNGDGGWWALGGPPSDAGHPNESERYRVSLVMGPRGRTLGEESSSLLRLDMVAGRAWLAEAALGARWSEIAEPGPATAGP